ncbi:hypothetical protein KUCAC02_008912 [Chaenocephalus aceratus]|uniref:Uncharacterized protein n=1 Tax=Chaenocephalus aceratus TaxID=36190 RepID=A0ACB9WTH2_CHAAC|nr:hypothetical protein KUCAC02_008912 [Chaenocephalus aceratus]
MVLTGKQEGRQQSVASSYSSYCLCLPHRRPLSLLVRSSDQHKASYYRPSSLDKIKDDSETLKMVKLKDGVAFLGARASNPVVWTVSQEVRSEGHRVVTLHCRRKENSYSQRAEAPGYQRVLQVDLEVNGLVVTQGGREVTWQVEYPLTRTLTSEVPTLIRLASQDLGGIVPLAMDTEILNTAVLNGRTVAVPVKVVTVGTDGAVSDVTESVECKSTDEQVIKVSERCDYVYVNGKETRGRTRVMLNFTYSFLSAQLEMSVWMPRLPLLIDVADPELSQIKGWRVPASTGNRRYERVTDDREEDDDAAGGRTDSGCVAQYQSTTLRVLSPLTSSVLAERSIRVLDDKESLISAWLQFSDGSMTALDNYNPSILF